MKNSCNLLLIVSVLLLSGCGMSRAGLRVGITQGFSQVDEYSAIAGGEGLPLTVEDESNNVAPTLALSFRQMIWEGFFVMTEPGIRINHEYSTIFRIEQSNVTPQWKTEITRKHTSVDLPILLGYNIPGSDFDVNVALGVSYTSALNSSQQTYGYTDANGDRVSRSWKGVNSDGGSDHDGLLAVGVLNLEKPLSETFAIGFDLRYLRSLDYYYTHPGTVSEPTGGQSEHYNYKARFSALGISVSAMLRM